MRRRDEVLQLVLLVALLIVILVLFLLPDYCCTLQHHGCQREEMLKLHTEMPVRADTSLCDWEDAAERDADGELYNASFSVALLSADWKVSCSGVLVDAQRVVTAAHCFQCGGDQVTHVMV